MNTKNPHTMMKDIPNLKVKDLALAMEILMERR